MLLVVLVVLVVGFVFGVWAAVGLVLVAVVPGFFAWAEWREDREHVRARAKAAQRFAEKKRLARDHPANPDAPVWVFPPADAE